MTVLGDSRFPTKRTKNSTKIGRAAAFAGAGVLAAINAIAGAVIGAIRHEPLIIQIANLAGVSAVVWFAIYVALKIGWEAPPEKLRKADWLALALTVASAMIPVSDVARAGLVICAVYAFATTRQGEPTRRVALVLVALTGTVVWGLLLLHVFAAPLVTLDAHIVARAIGSTAQGNIVRFINFDDSFVIGKGCSSVHNMSLAILLWCTGVALFDLRVDGRLLAFGAAMIALMFGLNIARLSTIGIFPDHFEFLHEGAGAALFSWVGLASMGTLALLGFHDALSRRS